MNRLRTTAYGSNHIKQKPETKPVVAVMLNLNPDTSHSDYLSEIDGTDYGVDNTVKSENELTEGTYSFEIKKNFFNEKE